MSRLLVLLALLGGLLTLGAPAAADEDTTPRTVRVGTEGVYPPFTYRDPESNQLTGFDIEVTRAIAEEAGWDVEFVEAPFDSLFPALDSERIDVIANQVTVNPEREARYLFSTPYTYSRGVIVTAADTDDITTLADLEGRTTAQTASSNWAQVARRAGAKVKYVQDFGPGVELLIQGRVDATVNDNIAVLDYLATSGTDEVKIAGTAGDEVLEQALTFRRSDPGLRDEADAALATLTEDGTLAEISEEYFGADVTQRERSGEVEVQGSDARSRTEVLQDGAWDMLVGLVKGTIPLTVVAFAIGMVLAVAAALARLSTLRVLDWIARFYISLIRGTPLLVQLFTEHRVPAAVHARGRLLLGGLLCRHARPGSAGAPAGEAPGMTEPTGTTDLIEVRGLEKAFGEHRVLTGVDFTAAAGTVTVLLGPSGSGKTTVLRSLNVLERPDAGWCGSTTPRSTSPPRRPTRRRTAAR